MRVEIGRPPGRLDAADFVLRDFSPAEGKGLPCVLDEAAYEVGMLCIHDEPSTWERRRCCPPVDS